MFFLQRRKKNICYATAACAAIYVICHFMYLYDDHKFTALRPLYDAQNEAKRLLKFMTSYHYQCNTTVQLGNRTYWPVCVEPDGNIVLEGREPILAYSVGPSEDLVFERNLVQNYSCKLVVIHHDRHFVDSLHNLNNTKLLTAQIMANDYADFSRNSYGQTTINAVLERFGHKKLDILKLEFVAGDVALWEILHFMIMDHILQTIKQVYIAVSVDKLEDDYLYSWYRALYDLFYREGFRLYHTDASNPLCLQVTMMQSCIYYLSWIKSPGLSAFVMHPPADFGSAELERSRLMTYLNHHVNPDLCERLVKISDHTAQFNYCQSNSHLTTRTSCNVFIVSSEHTDLWSRALDEDQCMVHAFTQHERGAENWDVNHNNFRAYKLVPGQISPLMGSHVPDFMDKVIPGCIDAFRFSRHSRDQRSFLDIEQRLSNTDHVTLLVLDLPDMGWVALSYLLDHESLRSVSQLMLTIRVDDTVDGLHQSALRRKFSELQRLESHGFRMFSGQGLGPRTGSVYRLTYIRI